MNSNTELSLTNTTTNAGTITLPLISSTPGRVLTFKDIQGTFGTNNLTLVCSGSDMFEDNSTTKVLRESYGSIQVVGSDSKWYILNGTQVNIIQVSTLNALAISSFNISTIDSQISSLTFIDSFLSTTALNVSSAFISTENVSTNFLYYNNFVIAGTRIGYSNLLNRTTFSPRNIPNLALWLDAADPFNNGTTLPQSTLMSNWVDKSTFRDDAFQTTVANQPNYNTNGFINFNGSNAFFNLSDISFVVNTSFSVFMVEQRQSAATNYIINGLTPNLALQNLHIGYRANTTFTFAFWAADLDGTVPAFTTLSTEPFRIWSLIYTGSRRTIFLNGTSIATQNFSQNLINTPNGRIGNNNFALPFFYTGNISEIIFTKPFIDGFMRQQTEGYLAWKWGLQANLPASHPFRNAPP